MRSSSVEDVDAAPVGDFDADAEASAVRSASDALRRLLLRFPTTFEDDEDILRVGGAKLPLRKRFGLFYRMGRKRILRRCQREADAMLGLGQTVTPTGRLLQWALREGVRLENIDDDAARAAGLSASELYRIKSDLLQLVRDALGVSRLMSGRSAEGRRGMRTTW